METEHIRNMSDSDKKKKETKKNQEVLISDTEACFQASSPSLSDWNRPEEDEAWKDL